MCPSPSAVMLPAMPMGFAFSSKPESTKAYWPLSALAEGGGGLHWLPPLPVVQPEIRTRARTSDNKESCRNFKLHLASLRHPICPGPLLPKVWCAAVYNTRARLILLKSCDTSEAVVPRLRLPCTCLLLPTAHPYFSASCLTPDSFTTNPATSPTFQKIHVTKELPGSSSRYTYPGTAMQV